MGKTNSAPGFPISYSCPDPDYDVAVLFIKSEGPKLGKKKKTKKKKKKTKCVSMLQCKPGDFSPALGCDRMFVIPYGSIRKEDLKRNANIRKTVFGLASAAGGWLWC